MVDIQEWCDTLLFWYGPRIRANLVNWTNWPDGQGEFMKTRKKGRVTAKHIAKMLIDAALEGMKGLDPEEQERRLKAFSDAAAGRLRTRRSASGSSRAASCRMVARSRP